MNDLHFLVPDALVSQPQGKPDGPGSAAAELLRGLELPNLDFISAHARTAPSGLAQTDLLTPWQSWLANAQAPNAAEADRQEPREQELRGQQSRGQEPDRAEPNLAELWAPALEKAARGETAAESGDKAARRWLLEPVHLRVGLDRVALLDPERLDLTPGEAAELAEAARATLEGDGWHLNAASPRRWLVARAANLEASDGFDLHGAALERVVGQGIESWLPRSKNDADARAWRRTSNEIQMIWFAHRVNAAREAAGKLPVNGLWISGNGGPPARRRSYSRVVSSLPLASALPIDSAAGIELETFGRMTHPLRDQDWGEWRDAVHALDARLGEILGEMRGRRRSGRRDVLRLILTGEHNLRDLTVHGADFWKFWRSGHADELLAEPAD